MATVVGKRCSGSGMAGFMGRARSLVSQKLPGTSQATWSFWSCRRMGELEAWVCSSILIRS